MSFNGDTGVAKRQRTDMDGVPQRVSYIHTYKISCFMN